MEWTAGTPNLQAVLMYAVLMYAPGLETYVVTKGSPGVGAELKKANCCDAGAEGAKT